MTSKIPRSKQLYFYMMPEETVRLLEFIAHEGGTIFAARSSGQDAEELISYEGCGQVYFSGKELSERVGTIKISDTHYVVDIFSSPVVELDRCCLGSSGLGKGRLYFRGGYDGREGWVSYPPDLYGLFARAMKFSMRSLLTDERVFGAYVSKQSKKFLLEGGRLVR